MMVNVINTKKLLCVNENNFFTLNKGELYDTYSINDAYYFRSNEFGDLIEIDKEGYGFYFKEILLGNNG